jgi:hypothetical protein
LASREHRRFQSEAQTATQYEQPSAARPPNSKSRRRAEFNFAPANHHVIEDAKQADDSGFDVYALTIDGTEIRQINDGGDGACSIE